MSAKPSDNPIAMFWTIIAGAFTYAILGSAIYGIIRLAIEIVDKAAA